jgi:hypothetical protein
MISDSFFSFDSLWIDKYKERVPQKGSTSPEGI